MTIRFKLILAAIAVVVVANSILTLVAVKYFEHFLLLTAVATAVSLGLIYAVTMLGMRPVVRIVAMSRKVIAGDMTARVGIRPPGELGLLCQAIDAMAEAVARRETQLTQAVRQQVSRAEKLASIGRLAAGVAHEINNPLTGVLTFAHLLRQKPHMSEEDNQDLDLIIHETTRAAEIVRGLLDFARERPTQNGAPGHQRRGAADGAADRQSEEVRAHSDRRSLAGRPAGSLRRHESRCSKSS